MTGLTLSKNGTLELGLLSLFKKTITFNVIPSDASIFYSINGDESKLLKGNILNVKKGARVEYSIKKDGYTTVSDTIDSLTENNNVEVSLERDVILL